MVLVIAEEMDGEIRDITYEILAKATEVAEENNSKVRTVLLAEDPEEHTEKLKSWTHELIVFQDESLENFNLDIYRQVISNLVEETDSRLILLGHTSQGMELSPSLATELEIPLVTDVIGLEWENDKPSVEREIFGGKVISEVEFEDNEKYMLTVRPATFEKTEPPELNADVIEKDPQFSEEEVKREVLGLSKPEAGEVDITSSDKLVGVGRGIGSEKENLEIIEELAEAVGGDICCTRPLVDKEWYSESRLVGQSGKTVEPELFIAIGISGEFYFTQGMENSDTIIAVNKDSDAPIFRVADYGIVDDLFDVAPQLSEALQES